jgi:hypothetical protein
MKEARSTIWRVGSAERRNGPTREGRCMEWHDMGRLLRLSLILV